MSTSSIAANLAENQLQKNNQEQQKNVTDMPTTTISPQSASTPVAGCGSGTAASQQQQQSPRNTSANISNSGTYLQFGAVEVSKSLQQGDKFVKWDEVSLFLSYLFYVRCYLSKQTM